MQDKKKNTQDSQGQPGSGHKSKHAHTKKKTSATYFDLNEVRAGEHDFKFTRLNTIQSAQNFFGSQAFGGCTLDKSAKDGQQSVVTMDESLLKISGHFTVYQFLNLPSDQLAVSLNLAQTSGVNYGNNINGTIQSGANVVHHQQNQMSNNAGIMIPGIIVQHNMTVTPQNHQQLLSPISHVKQTATIFGGADNIMSQNIASRVANSNQSHSLSKLADKNILIDESLLKAKAIDTYVGNFGCYILDYGKQYICKFADRLIQDPEFQEQPAIEQAVELSFCKFEELQIVSTALPSESDLNMTTKKYTCETPFRGTQYASNHYQGFTALQPAYNSTNKESEQLLGQSLGYSVADIGARKITKYGFKLYKKITRSKQSQTTNKGGKLQSKSCDPQALSPKNKDKKSSKYTTYNMLVFIFDTKEECDAWIEALECYIIQSAPVTSHYEVGEKLGNGTFGYVFLAHQKCLKQKNLTQLNPLFNKSHSPNQDCSKNNNQSSGLSNKDSANLKQTDQEEFKRQPSQNSENNKVAIKILKKAKIAESSQGLTFLLNEIRVHWSLEQCVCVLRLLKIYEDKDLICLVLEYQSQGSLMNTIMKNVKLEESEVRVIMEQMLLAIDFFQKKKIVHRDIKLDNILINSIEEKKDYEIRMADFGLAAFSPNDEPLMHKCGSPGYVAPEVFKGNGYSYKADIFSLGAVFFNLISGRYLFSGKDLPELIKRNIECQTDTIKQFLVGNSPQCRELMMWMIQADPNDRPTAKQALQHSWFTADRQILTDLLAVNQLICSRSPASATCRNLKDKNLSGTIGSESYPYAQQIGSFRLGNGFAFQNLRNNSSSRKESDVSGIYSQGSKVQLNSANNSSALQQFIQAQQSKQAIQRDDTLQVPQNSNFTPKRPHTVNHGLSNTVKQQNIRNSNQDNGDDQNSYQPSQRSIRIHYFQAIRNSRSGNRSSFSASLNCSLGMAGSNALLQFAAMNSSASPQNQLNQQYSGQVSSVQSPNHKDNSQRRESNPFNRKSQFYQQHQKSGKTICLQPGLGADQLNNKDKQIQEDLSRSYQSQCNPVQVVQRKQNCENSVRQRKGIKKDYAFPSAKEASKRQEEGKSTYSKVVSKTPEPLLRSGKANLQEETKQDPPKEDVVVIAPFESERQGLHELKNSRLAVKQSHLGPRGPIIRIDTFARELAAAQLINQNSQSESCPSLVNMLERQQTTDHPNLQNMKQLCNKGVGFNERMKMSQRNAPVIRRVFLDE